MTFSTVKSNPNMDNLKNFQMCNFVLINGKEPNLDKHLHIINPRLCNLSRQLHIRIFIKPDSKANNSYLDKMSCILGMFHCLNWLFTCKSLQNSLLCSSMILVLQQNQYQRIMECINHSIQYSEHNHSQHCNPLHILMLRRYRMCYMDKQQHFL